MNITRAFDLIPILNGCHVFRSAFSKIKADSPIVAVQLNATLRVSALRNGLQSVDRIAIT